MCDSGGYEGKGGRGASEWRGRIVDCRDRVPALKTSVKGLSSGGYINTEVRTERSHKTLLTKPAGMNTRHCSSARTASPG